MIELRRLNKTFYKNDREITALSDVSLFVPKGQIFGIIGASGAGKSTLIRCVNLLEKPDSGEVLIDGKSLTALTSRELTIARRNIGMIFQHFNLMSSRTVWQNVALPLELNGTNKADIHKRVSELLALVGLEAKANDYPANLSGGQKQRVAIARALATNPKVLLCDEATSALDPATTASILALLKDINKRFDITILLITHEMNVVKSICDKVAVIHEGKITEQGNVREIAALAASEISLPDVYQKQLSSYSKEHLFPVIKLEFDKDTSTVFLSEASRLYHIDNNIVSARVDDEHTYNVLIIVLKGDSDNTKKAIAYYQDKKIKTEELGYV